MAFVFKNIMGLAIPEIAGALDHAIRESRFNAQLEFNDKRISIRGVRLRKSKDYCGNHPFACPVRANPIPHKHLDYLEGADWVAFNDMLNDVLDDMAISADVASSLVIIRKGFKRCVQYTGHALGNSIDNEWDKDSGHFRDCINHKAGRAKFPNGTPGVPEYLPSKAQKYPNYEYR